MVATGRIAALNGLFSPIRHVAAVSRLLPRESVPKRLPDRCFCRAQTHIRQIMLLRTEICSNSSHLCTECVRCGLKKRDITYQQSAFKELHGRKTLK